MKDRSLIVADDSKLTISSQTTGPSHCRMKLEQGESAHMLRADWSILSLSKTSLEGPGLHLVGG